MADEFLNRWSSSTPTAEYFKQTIEMIPTVVCEEIDEWGKTAQDTVEEAKEYRRQKYEELKEEFGNG
jgi:chloramphenicol O-acetyltransferase